MKTHTSANTTFFKRYPAQISGLIVGLLVGLMLISIVFPVSRAKQPDETDQAMFLVSHALDVMEKNTFRPVTTKEAVYEGIHGMCRTLDPYTHFLDEESYSYMHAQQEGSFYGIGISFDIRDGQLLVISPIEDSPAWKLGMRAGDIIVGIEGESTAGISSAEVLNKLRGKKGTTVNITVKRHGVDQPVPLSITRDKITLNSIRGGFMLDKQTGYIRITEFSSTTGRDLLDLLKKLNSLGMTQLLLDLRYNGGGLLSAADEVSSTFLKKGQLIVSTRGRDPRDKMELVTRRSGQFKDLPIIVLVNEGSASASEIVAGAIQDHDRGLVVGKPTHGKGLVGSQYPNKLGTAIQITTAQYFTPSGRNIQRPYNLPHRHVLASGEDSAIARGDKEIHFTDNGRKVYGGGGITPDVELKDDLLSPNMITLESERVFFDFAVDRGSAYQPVTMDTIVTDAMFADFLDYCDSRETLLNKDEIAKDEPAMRTAIKRDLLTVYIDADAGEQVRVKSQRIVQEALKLFKDIDKYLSGKTGTDKKAA